MRSKRRKDCISLSFGSDNPSPLARSSLYTREPQWLYPLLICATLQYGLIQIKDLKGYYTREPLYYPEFFSKNGDTLAICKFICIYKKS